jgi:hypothetical protein
MVMTPVIPMLRRHMQDGGQWEASLGYIARLHLKEKKRKEGKKPRHTEKDQCKIHLTAEE